MAGPERGYGTPMLGKVVSTAAWSSAVALLAVGCAGTPSSTSAWQGSSDRALGELISGLGTARLVVVAESRDRMPHTYSVTALTDAVDSGNREISGYVLGQPPDDLHLAQEAVTTALEDAADLLVEVRVEVSSPGVDHGAARRLVERIDAMRDRLDQLDTSVKRSPESVGR